MSLVNFKHPSMMVNSIVMLVVALLLLVGLLPSAITAIGNLSTVSGLGFSSFYGSGGVVLLDNKPITTY